MSPPVSFSLLRFGFAGHARGPRPRTGGRDTSFSGAESGDSLSLRLSLQKTKKEGAYSPTRSLPDTRGARVHARHNGSRTNMKHEKERAHQGTRGARRADARRRGAAARDSNQDPGTSKQQRLEHGGWTSVFFNFIITPGGPLTRPRGHRADPSPTPSPGPPLSLRQGRQGRRRLGALARRPHAQHVELEDVCLAAEQVAERRRGAPEVAVHKLLDVRPRLGEVGKVNSSTHTRWWGKGRATPHNSMSK